MSNLAVNPYMKLKTLIRLNHKLVVAEIELQLIAGIPQIHFLGLPDKVIRESFLRIKSALKSAGFRFPITHQLIVNIRPLSLKKTSLGLELAVALGILYLTGQVEAPENIESFIIYGELDLDGHVREPNDLIHYVDQDSQHIITGLNTHSGQDPRSSDGSPDENIHHHHISRLTHLSLPVQVSYALDSVQNKTKLDIRPQAGLNSSFSALEAELLFLMSTSQLHTLVAGQAGAGKSYLTNQYSSFIMNFGQNYWPQVISPHHSLTKAGFIGGGAHLFEGEIEKLGPSGILILDELLEFNTEVIELLRIPMTGAPLRLNRAGHVKIIQPDFQVIATTNFCPCGKWTPQKSFETQCRFNKKKCFGYLQKLSGPLIDRFGIIFFHHRQLKNNRHILGHDILKRIHAFHELSKNRTRPTLSSTTDRFFDQIYGALSGRRNHALIKIAEIYAIESNSPKIELLHLNKSEEWTIKGFTELEAGYQQH